MTCLTICSSHVPENAIALNKLRGQNHEPRREHIRAEGQAAPDSVRQHPPTNTDFVRVGIYCAGILTPKHMQVFMFCQSRNRIMGPVFQVGDLCQGNSKAEFFMKSSCRRCMSLFTGARVPTTGIRPKPGKMIFLRSPLLQQNFSMRVRDENREGTMQLAAAMSWKLARRADHVIFCIDQNNGLALILNGTVLGNRKSCHAFN